MNKTSIGRIERIRRYPVKSMAGSDIQTAYVHETGINGDRIYAFYDYNSLRPSLPYLTVRELSEMLLLQARIVDEEAVDKPYSVEYKPQVMVTVEGEDIPLHDNRLLTYLQSKLQANYNLTIDYRKSGIHDTKPISIVSMQSINTLAEENGQSSLDPLRFRSNFYFQWDNNESFYEEQLVGKSLQIGSEVVLHIVKSNIRCTIINVDPQSAEKDSSILKTVSQQHDTKFGIYAEIRTCGLVNTGDTVYVIK